MVADSINPQDPAEEGDLHKDLTPRQERAIIALLNRQTITQAAEAAGVGERTLYTWLDEPEFSRPTAPPAARPSARRSP